MESISFGLLLIEISERTVVIAIAKRRVNQRKVEVTSNLDPRESSDHKLVSRVKINRKRNWGKVTKNGEIAVASTKRKVGENPISTCEKVLKQIGISRKDQPHGEMGNGGKFQMGIGNINNKKQIRRKV